jgi:hypothetical protein
VSIAVEKSAVAFAVAGFCCHPERGEGSRKISPDLDHPDLFADTFQAVITATIASTA